MKKTIWFFIAGILVALVGLFVVSDLFGHLFNGMDYGSACTLGIGLYLCVVIVTCTGILLSKLEESKHAGDSHQEDQP